MIRIVVDGAPVGKGRPRFFVRRNPGTGGRLLGAQTPAKTANYEAILAAAGATAMDGRAPLEGPLSVRLTAFMPLAQSWSRKKTAAAIAGEIRPGKPDLDNILKVLDALNQIVWRDDAQIAEARMSKVYDRDPRLEIEVEPIAAAAETGLVERGATPSAPVGSISSCYSLKCGRSRRRSPEMPPTATLMRR